MTKWNEQQKLTCEVGSQDTVSPGLRKVVEEFSIIKGLQKCDNRLTGSQVIDENLQEIIGYLIRDYIYVWYDKISDDEEFCYYVKSTGQKIVIEIASR